MSSPYKKEWTKAMEIELEQLNRTNTWKLVPRPSNKPIIKGRWVYKTKLNPDGSINKYKARWVAKGYEQKQGINYFDTFANTVKPTTYRLLLIASAINNQSIKQQDIISTFPNTDIDTEIYIEQPTGFNLGDNNQVYLLNKALYRLKQAARQWLLYLTNILNQLDFSSISSDTAVFVHKNLPIIIAIYVDNLLVFSKSEKFTKDLYNKLAKKLDIKDLGEANYYLGVEIIKKQGDIYLSQKGFIKRLLEKYNKLNIKPRATPYIIGEKLIKNTELATPIDIKTYQQEIGSLIYLAINTRPDISYKVNLLARFMSNPSKEHFNSLNYLWGYLNRTQNLAIKIARNNPTNSSNQPTPYNLEGYSDADWGGDYVSRRSTTGYTFYLNNYLISWYSKL